MAKIVFDPMGYVGPNHLAARVARMSADRYVLTVRENGPNGGYGVIARRVMTAAEWQALDAALVDKHSPCSFSDANTHYSLRNYALTGEIDDSGDDY